MGADWRVADWEVDFLRSYLAANFGAAYEADAAFVTLMHGIFRETKEAEKQLLTAMFDCLGRVDVGGISALRNLFEDGLREGFAQGEGRGVPTRVAECATTTAGA